MHDKARGVSLWGRTRSLYDMCVALPFVLTVADVSTAVLVVAGRRVCSRGGGPCRRCGSAVVLLVVMMSMVRIAPHSPSRRLHDTVMTRAECSHAVDIDMLTLFASLCGGDVSV